MNHGVNQVLFKLGRRGLPIPQVRVPLVDRMASKGIIHRNTAARYKSRLSARVSK